MAKLLLDKVKDEALILKLRTSYNLITEDINHTQTVVSLDNLDENVVTDIVNLASGNKEMMSQRNKLKVFGLMALKPMW